MKKPSKICSLLFPKSSIIFLVLMGIAFSKPNSISESLDLPEWIMAMGVVFIICVIPYDLIRWLLWGRNKYYRKYSQYEKAYCKNPKRMISKDEAKEHCTTRHIEDVRNKKMHKLLSFLLPFSSIIVLTILGLLLKTAVINNERPIIFSEWIILMCWYFVTIILPYDLIRWFLWGKRKYLKKYESKRTFYKYTNPITNEEKIEDFSSINNQRSNKYKQEMTEEKLRCFALMSNHELEIQDRKDNL